MTSPMDAERLLRRGVAPRGMIVDGDLYIEGARGVRSLPDGMTVLGDLDIGDCPRLAGEVRIEEVTGVCEIWNCHALDAVSVGRAGADIDIWDCHGLGRVRVERAPVILLRDLPSLAEIDHSEINHLEVHRSNIVRWPKPKGNESIRIEDCPLLVELPSPFRADSLTIWNCSSLRGLPADTRVRGNVAIMESGLRTIGSGVDVGGELIVWNCREIRRIDARVGGDGRVEECPRFDPDARPSDIPPILGVSP